MQSDFEQLTAAATLRFKVGGALLVFGMLSTVVAMTPAVTAAVGTPWFWVMAMTTGPGLLLLLLGARAQAKARTAASARMRESR